MAVERFDQPVTDALRAAGLALSSATDLFCIDTDAIGVGGYGVDLSRTYLCGDRAASGQGAKLEDQFLIHPDRVERLTTAPFDERLS